MKVYIGPYPYELSCKIYENHMIKKYDSSGYFMGYSDGDKVDKFYYIAEKFIQKLIYDPLNWLYFSRIKNQKVRVKIDYWDVWNMDYTLSHIILPMLKLLKECQHGCPVTDGSDVPEHLSPPSTFETDFEKGKVDDKNTDRWNYILDEMIWSFESILNDDMYDYQDANECKKHNERISNGLKLFGKYYRGLWD